ncbi:hypothetical protein JCM24511_03963 [Saitozyma sp. JCM 24511]|nr:hypothetical protein JCM24511_03963 [Saitozyma sp. JCM 24511]
MAPRPSLHAVPESSSSGVIQTSRPHALYPLFSRLTFHVVPAKLDGDLARIYECIEELGGKHVSVEDARFVITGLQGRPRLLRAIGKEWIDVKPILRAEYIYDTFQNALDAAVDTSGSVPHLPDRRKYLVNKGIGGGEALKRTRSVTRDDEGFLRPRKRRKGSPNWEDEKGEAELPDMELFDEHVKFADIPRLCVERASPLVCVNQDIINAIKPIYEDREFEESQQKNANVLSYRRSMSVSPSHLDDVENDIAVPRRIRSGKEARKLQDVGEKVANRIDEFLQTGHIEESETILASKRYQLLTDFASIYTVGHHKAKELYDKFGCRSIDDVLFHYRERQGEEVGQKERYRRRREGGMSHVEIVEEWVRLKPELDEKIPRAEVEEIAECVMEHLGAFLDGCEYTICGGYRRGKPQSGDIDVVFCPPEKDQDIGLLRDLYLRLSALGIITHVLHVTQRAPNEPIHASPQNFDNLDKAFVIFRLPGKSRLHRRVDLISAPRERYAAAVLSWSGSMMFERDLKRYAENRGYKFRAGLIKASTGEEVELETEREIFAFLGLRYVPPELRNADG